MLQAMRRTWMASPSSLDICKTQCSKSASVVMQEQIVNAALRT